MCSELTPRAPIPDTRIPQLMQPCQHICHSKVLFSGVFSSVHLTCCVLLALSWNYRNTDYLRRAITQHSPYQIIQSLLFRAAPHSLGRVWFSHNYKDLYFRLLCENMELRVLRSVLLGRGSVESGSNMNSWKTLLSQARHWEYQKDYEILSGVGNTTQGPVGSDIFKRSS